MKDKAISNGAMQLLGMAYPMKLGGSEFVQPFLHLRFLCGLQNHVKFLVFSIFAFYYIFCFFGEVLPNIHDVLSVVGCLMLFVLVDMLWPYVWRLWIDGG